MSGMPTMRILVIAGAVMLAAGFGAVAQADSPLLVRAESLLLLPQSKPLLRVRVANAGEPPVRATLTVKVPDSWRVDQLSQPVELAGGEETRLQFAVAGGVEESSNRYPLEIRIDSGESQWMHRQQIAVATAPYFKPEIDGDSSDWKDAVPVSFDTVDRRTTIATYWNRQQFCFLVSVDETRWVPRGTAEEFDAVQVAMAPRGTVTGRSADQPADRFEFLVFGDASGTGHCCQLLQPDMALGAAMEKRVLDPLLFQKSQVAVWRSGTVTHYEVSLPMTAMREHIRPSEGREFFFGVVVHDPDGTGIRQWGAAAGLWECQRNRLAWSDWEGARWGERPPLDCRTEWGMCSSKY